MDKKKQNVFTKVVLTKDDEIEICEADFFEATAKYVKGEIDDIPSYMRKQDEEIKGRLVITGGPYPVKKKKKIGMKLFVAMNWVMGIVFLVSACAVDSESWFPTIVCALSVAYLGCALYIYEALRAKRK